MKKALSLLWLCLLAVTAHADRITALVTVTNTPSDGDSFSFNGNVRTWKTAVTTPALQIAIAGSIGANTTNFWFQVIGYPFTGPVSPIWIATNQFQLRAAAGQAVSASVSGTWGTVSFSTQAVFSATAVALPLASEPTPSTRTNLASLLVADIFNNHLATNAASATSTVLSNYVNTVAAQTIGGNKTFSGDLTMQGLLQMQYALFMLTNSGIYMNPGSFMIFSTNVTIMDILLVPKWVFSSVEQPKAITTFQDLTNKITALKAASSAFTGTNSFAQITNSVITGSVVTNSTISGTASGLTGTATNLVHRGALQSYSVDNSNVEMGLGAVVTNGFTASVAIGRNAWVGGSSSTAVGKNAVVSHNFAAAIGANAATTEDHQLRLGTSSEYLSAPGGVKAGGNSYTGDPAGAFVAGMTNGRQMTNGAPASADPANAVAEFSVSGEWQYRTSAASEGAGQVNRIHNRGEQVTGSGADYTIPDTSYDRVDFGGVDPQIVLPTAGTYLLSATVSVVAGAAAFDDFRFKFVNSTDSADITSSDRRLTNVSTNQTAQVRLENIVTVTGSKTIQLYGQNLTAARGTIEAQRTSVTYVRLY